MSPDEPALLPPSDAVAGPQATGWLDALAYSSVLAAGVAGSLTAAATLAFELPFDLATVMLAISGTLVVYNIDHLRDLARDQSLAPRRSRFIARNLVKLRVITLLAAVSSGICAWQLSHAARALCATIFVLGLLHRRLKRIRGVKTLYLTASWLAIVLGLPLLGPSHIGTHDAAPGAEQIYWVSTILGCAILSNLMASNLDRRIASHRSQLAAATAIAGLGIGFALLAPRALSALAMIPAAEFVALSRFRDGERYRAVVIDGALCAGAVGAISFMIWLARY